MKYDIYIKLKSYNFNIIFEICSGIGFKTTLINFKLFERFIIMFKEKKYKKKKNFFYLI